MRHVPIIFLLLILTIPALASDNHPPFDLDIQHDIPYATLRNDENEQRFLDVYAPTVAADWATVVLFHGGSGSKDDLPMVDLSRAIAEQGAVVFNVSTSQVDGARYFREDGNGAGIRRYHEEGVCAIRFARDMAADYGGTGEQLILFGQSAGGYVGLWLSLVGDDVAQVWDSFANGRGGPAQQVDCVADNSISIVPDAMIGYAGAYIFFNQEQFTEEDPELQQLIQPQTYIGNNTAVKLRFVFGRNDRDMPDFAVDWSEELYNDLAATGYNITWTLMEGRHMFPTHRPAFEPLLAVIQEVLTSVDIQQ